MNQQQQIPTKAKIVEQAVGFYLDMNVLGVTLPIDLIVKGGNLTKTITLTADDKKFAIDCLDWKSGRVVTGVEGVQIGNETIPFESVVLVSGSSHLGSHSLFARIDQCPDRPSGYTSAKNVTTTCFAVVLLECDPFPEEVDRRIFPSIEPSVCDMKMLFCIGGSTLSWTMNC